METKNDNQSNKNHFDFIIFYTIGIINAVFHIIGTLFFIQVGIVWEIISLPKGKSPLLAVPYFGGYLILIGIALISAFVYFFF